MPPCGARKYDWACDLGACDRGHDPGRLEAACRKALAAGDPSYRTIKGILALGTCDDTEARTTGDVGAPAFLHGPEQLFGTGQAAIGTAAADDTLPTRAESAVPTMPKSDAAVAMGIEAAR